MSKLMLGVNIDHIATLRNARGTIWPDPVQAAFIAEQSGADSITIHLREDKRHINDRDVYLLRQTIQTNMNLEISIKKSMLNMALKIKPNSCCLVPENRKEITTEGGLNLITQKERLRDVISELTTAGILVTVFIDADNKQIDTATEIGALCIEIHTGHYADASSYKMRNIEFLKIKHAVQYASNRGLLIHAGHGLNYYNVKQIATLNFIQELNIGHSIISRSVITGLANAVREMKNLISKM